ncbi:WAT1-related protein At2g39510-like [Cryptomeria japonica]|uniref:WAT1-related protein At2g39510-like n=1 Tax=Cryptomeria japonica TaxID=3369 RepID=UPI0027DA1648|nr:WAT1-related protein At2g39510-like [Cryptomeria japonica]
MGEVGKCWCGDLSAFFEKSKPSLAMIFVQFGFAGMNIISKMALNQGMSHFVLVFYRHLVATIVTAPLAYFLERKTRPRLTFTIFCEIFISSLFGITLNQIFYYSGLKYTTATFASALINLIPVITFLMAIIFRMEKVDFKSRAGQAKIIGTLVCVSGAMSMTFYKGIKIQLWPSPFHFGEHNESDSKNEDLTKGSLMVVSGCIFFSTWFIFQKSISKKYPAQYSSTTIMCSLVTIQSAVLTLVFERGHYGVWILGWNVKLLTAIYSGVVASGIGLCLMAWCVKKKGPVFTTMFSPLVLIIVAIVGSIFLDEKLHLGSVIGGMVIIIGLYFVLWGKAKEMKKIVKIPETSPTISSSKELNNMQHDEEFINKQQSEDGHKVEAREEINHKISVDTEHSLKEIVTYAQ